MSKTYREWVPDQAYMFPPSPRDWLAENDLVYFMVDTVATLDLNPGNWVIVGKGMVSAFAESPTAEASCTLVSGIGGSGPSLDHHSVAMHLGVHNTLTVAAPFTVEGSSDGHLELQCQTLDTTDGMVENAQIWAVQVGTLNTTVARPSF